MLNGPPLTGTGPLTGASNLVQAGLTFLGWITVRADGTNAVTVRVYDGVDANGILIDEIYVASGTYWEGRDYVNTVFPTGLFITISGTGGYVFSGYGKNFK